MDNPGYSGNRAELNSAVVRKMLHRLSEGDIGGFVDSLSPSYVRHCQAMPPGQQENRGRDAMRQWLIANQATFPDYHEDIEQLVAEGDIVAWRSIGRGTQRGPMGPFPATGKQMTIVIIGMHSFEGELVAETWTSWDNLAALTQLGLL